MLLLSLANLPRATYQASLVCPSEGTLRASAEKLGIPCYQAPAIQARFTYHPVRLAGYVLSIARSLTGLRTTLLSLVPDVIQANTVRAGIVATLATIGSRIPVIWHVHDILPVHPVTSLVKWLAHSTSRNHVVACSQAAANTLRKADGQGSRGVTVILNGIDIETYRRNDETRDQMRHDLGFAEEVFVIGILGQITKRKGHLGLLRAFAQVKVSVPNAVLVIVGTPVFNKDQKYFELLKGEVERLHIGDSVRFLGHRLDMPNVMQALDLIVVNSDVEPFALVLVEGLMMEKAAVATDSGGATELINPGISGEIVPVGDSRSLANAVIKLARDPSMRRVYGINGSRLVQAGLTTKTYIQKWQTLYGDIVASRAELNAVTGQQQGVTG